jgi:hypothetical protein
MAEKAMMINYVVLTSQIVLALEDAIRGKDLTEQQYRVLADGAKLLSRIIEGAMLVEGKEFRNGVVPTREGLSIYGYALSTIQKLDFIKERSEKEFTEFFENLHSEMVDFKEKREKGNKNVLQLKNFFIELGSSLRADIQRESFYREKTFPIMLKKQINGYVLS